MIFPGYVYTVEAVEYDPADGDTYPSVCQSPEEVDRRFGFKGGETLLFDQAGSYLGQVVKQLNKLEGD